MSIDALDHILCNEDRAHKFLSKKCLKNEHRFCPRCSQRKHYRLKDGRRRCSQCKYTFHDFSGRWINSGHLSCVQWLLVLRCFQQELPVRKISEKIDLSYNTALNAVNTLRYAILAHAEDASDFFCRKTGHIKCCYGGKKVCDNRRCLIEDVPVFGISETSGQVRVSVAPEVTPGFLIRSNIKKARKGSVVYTDQCLAYDGMMYYGYHHALVESDDRYPEDYIYLNRKNGFWTWAKDRLIKYYGVSSLSFPLYIKELEFRYNHRNLNFFDIMTKYICDLVPQCSR